MVPELIEKYIFLVQTFVEAGDRGLSLQEVVRRWENRYGTAYPRRTFLNHRAAVEEVFGIPIICDRTTNLYKIDQAESAVDKREATDYLINTFTVNSLLTLGRERLSGRVSVEDVPSGQKHLTPLMQAMLDNAVLRISYKKYMSEEADVRIVHPYAVKEFEKRWYTVAWSEAAGALRVYALDRIASLERTGESFRMPARFQVDDLFEASYGIYLPEGEKPVLVKLRTTLREAAYLQDLPLHPSQQLVGRDGDSCLFALRVIPNPNFVMELLRHGNRLEVLEPASLRRTVQEEHKKALQLYES
ncbi:MAG: WYL domain-containing protein [Bacteroidales bacterium]|nr:WYL domain-containing protein [Bacteroidales bacterium]